MSRRRFVDIDEVYDKLVGFLESEEEVFIPVSALLRAVAQATTLIVHEPKEPQN